LLSFLPFFVASLLLGSDRIIILFFFMWLFIALKDRVINRYYTFPFLVFFNIKSVFFLYAVFVFGDGFK